MPPRNVNELDPITLHNLAIMNMDEDPTGGFEKLTFLISSESFPRETFVNLCLLYLKYEVNIYVDIVIYIYVVFSSIMILLLIFLRKIRI
jgi:tetratricopeptide repeat protein 30